MDSSLDLDCACWMGVCLVEGMHRGEIFDLPQSSSVQIVSGPYLINGSIDLDGIFRNWLVVDCLELCKTIVHLIGTNRMDRPPNVNK